MSSVWAEAGAAFTTSRSARAIVGDHDDVWLPNKISCIAETFDEHSDAALVALDSEVVDENLASLGTTLRGGKRVSQKQASLAAKDDFKFFLLGARLDAHTLAFRGRVRAILKSANLGRLEGFWFENQVVAAALSFGRLYYLPDAPTLYRQHAKQHTRQHTGYRQPGAIVPNARDLAVKLTRLSFLRDWLEKNRFSSMLGSGEVQRRLKLVTDYMEFELKRDIRAGNTESILTPG